jgi:signal peptidase II
MPSGGGESEPVSAELAPEERAEARPSPNLRTLLLMLGGVTAPVVVLDQVTKLYVSSHMALYESIPLIPNLLDITYALNPGAAFSLFVSLPASLRAAFLFMFSAIAIVVIAILIARNPRPSVTSIALALILAGACGNLIDRATRGGRVIDFVRAHYYDYNWPIFNVADSAITIGVALILIASMFSSRPSQ